MKIVLCPNPYRDRGLRAALSAQRILENAGAETAICLPFEPDQGGRLEPPAGVSLGRLDEELADAGALVCFGGDGTILHAAHDANTRNIPILGVNLGSIGFMAELEHGELSLLARLAAGKFGIERRMMLDVSVRREGRCVFSEQALNDAVLTKGAVARVLDLEVTGDRVTISSFSGDGLVVSTPTGSTAYSMSAGGPIVEPTSENIAVTPICPHALYARSYILDRSRMVTVTPGEHSRRTAYLSVDGSKAFRLADHDQVELHRARGKARLVRLTDRSFYTVLNQKLGRR